MTKNDKPDFVTDSSARRAAMEKYQDAHGGAPSKATIATTLKNDGSIDEDGSKQTVVETEK